MQRFSKFSDVAFSGECSELLIGVKGSFGNAGHLGKLRLR